MLYPLKFEPVYKQIIWGGDKIAKRFHRTVPFEKVAESWEITCRGDGMSVVKNGALCGKTLGDVINEHPRETLGDASIARYGERFPLLVKLIDAADRLSVQVHPDDAYARKAGEENGKNEMWYVVDAREGAQLVFGLKKGVTKEAFARAVAGGRVEETLKRVPVKRGDAFFIRAGTVHAILDGILIAEIQQNSNTTYRIYDWGRVGKDGRPRELHVAQALDVIRFEDAGAQPETPQTRDDGGAEVRQLVRSEFFHVDEVSATRTWRAETGGSFMILNVLEGGGSLEAGGVRESLSAGESLLLPACLGGFTVTGALRLLATGV